MQSFYQRMMSLHSHIALDCDNAYVSFSETKHVVKPFAVVMSTVLCSIARWQLSQMPLSANPWVFRANHRIHGFPLAARAFLRQFQANAHAPPAPFTRLNHLYLMAKSHQRVIYWITLIINEIHSEIHYISCEWHVMLKLKMFLC